ncbi:hypothetical protein EK21DRAFT_63545 [Setomelanomma holmii]|uniref:Uncharacterized protein n=1 Tax=Setomelanomma holmii TaxID=210430 RepID=A0A9P4LP15_9PLEO|nr:hypothetical protein EK21DRAFT_63545 [Setomelanomma holmii]
MASYLTAWLEETFATQLLLGNDWLQLRSEQKGKRVKPDPEQAWRGLYHDNGSCLDITNEIHPEHDSCLRVIQAWINDGLSPFVLTDGQTQVHPHIAPECQQHFPPASEFRLDAVLAVRKYSIRYTSYGPPPDKLRFILHAFDWLGDFSRSSQELGCEGLKPLWSEDILDILRQLHNTRAQEDRRCLGSDPSVDEAASRTSTVMGNTDDGESQFNMQYAFGTQMVHPVRSRPSQDDPKLLGTRRLEPVLAGNTQREEIRPRAPVQGTKRVREVYAASPRADNTTTEPASYVTAPEETHGDRLQRLASECSWMRDFEFSRESLSVPYNQVSILQSDDSWHKPLVGKRFPDGNIPISILTMFQRLADETAAMEAQPDSDDEMDEDPSPKDPSPGSPSQPTQNDETLTQVSWSPSPEPPEMPSRPNQGLPPDSSFDILEAVLEHTEQEVLAPPIKHNIVVTTLSNRKERSVPPWSPPVEPDYDEIQEAAVYEDDMEMEEFVPQGLGDDDIVGASKPQLDRAVPLSPPPMSIVQVKETPYVRGKSKQPVGEDTSPRPPKDSSSGTSKENSSTSIIFGTYKDGTSSALAADDIHRRANDATMINQTLHSLEQARPESGHARISSRYEVLTTLDEMSASIKSIIVPKDLQQSQMQQPTVKSPIVEKDKIRSSPQPSTVEASEQKTTTSTVNVSASPEAKHHLAVQGETISTKIPLLPSGSIKRKLENSPSKKSSRHSKRRELKIVSFGDASPSPTDPMSALRQHREVSLRKFREERKSSTSFESPHVSAARSTETTEDDAMELESPTVHRSNESGWSVSPRHSSLYEAPAPAGQVQHTVTVTQSAQAPSQGAQIQIENTAPIDTQHTSADEPRRTLASDAEPHTVFETFKATYPEYTGDKKHFQGQCLQMIKLDQEDKMVPKWQWDDYIVRNRSDYKDYALDCIDRGEDAIPYHRFYKDTIRDTLYRKGVIETRATLLKALEQFGIQPPASASVPSLGPKVIEEHKHIPLKEKRSRISLPGAFNEPKPAAKHQVNGKNADRPRHSLPVSSQAPRQIPLQSVLNPQVRTPAPSASKDVPKGSRASKPNLLSRLSLDGASSPRTSKNDDTTEGASDPFRNFYFAYQRTTSLTGSTKVSRRPSGEGPRKS